MKELGNIIKLFLQMVEFWLKKLDDNVGLILTLPPTVFLKSCIVNAISVGQSSIEGNHAPYLHTTHTNINSACLVTLIYFW